MKKAFWLRRVVGFIILAIAGVLLISFIVMNLWNTVLVAAVNVRAINFGQALGIFLLAKILFGFRGGGWRGRGSYWNKQMREKWQTMSPEEKEKFKQEWRSRCYRNKEAATGNTASE